MKYAMATKYNVCGENRLALHFSSRRDRTPTYDDGRHPDLAFSAREDTRHDKDQDDDRYRCNGDPEFGVMCVDYDDDELYNEAQEQEEVEFEKGDIDLASVSKVTVMVRAYHT